MKSKNHITLPQSAVDLASLLVIFLFIISGILLVDGTKTRSDVAIQKWTIESLKKDKELLALAARSDEYYGYDYYSEGLESAPYKEYIKNFSGVILWTKKDPKPDNPNRFVYLDEYQVVDSPEGEIAIDAPKEATGYVAKGKFFEPEIPDQTEAEKEVE